MWGKLIKIVTKLPIINEITSYSRVSLSNMYIVWCQFTSILGMYTHSRIRKSTVWIYEVNIYFISFHFLPLKFLSPRKLFTHGLHFIRRQTRLKYTPQNAKTLLCVYVGVCSNSKSMHAKEIMIVNALLLAQSGVNVFCKMRANKTIIMFNQKSQKIH